MLRLIFLKTRGEGVKGIYLVVLKGLKYKLTTPSGGLAYSQQGSCVFYVSNRGCKWCERLTGRQ